MIGIVKIADVLLKWRRFSIEEGPKRSQPCAADPRATTKRASKTTVEERSICRERGGTRK
jgi:hypothetical protein